MTLKAQFSAALILYTALVLSLFTGTYYFFERRAAGEAQHLEQINTLEKVAAVCRDSLVAANPLAALNYVKAVKAEPAVVFASCIDQKGFILAHSEPSRIAKTLPADVFRPAFEPDEMARSTYRAADGNWILQWDAPVTVQGSKVGIAQVAYNQAMLTEQIRARLWSSLKQPLWVAACTFVLAIVFGIMLAWRLSRPIDRLEEAARAFGAGQLDYQTPITQRQDELGRLAREMSSMAAKLKQLDQLKDDFVALVSHDLRGPLSGITMYADYLLQGVRGPLNEAQASMLKIIEFNAKRLAIFINNILDAAKIKAGRMEYHIEPRNLDELTREIVALLQVLMHEQEIQFTYEVDLNLPLVRADGEKVQQVVTNLLANAIKFTPREGRIKLKIESPPGPFVRVSIQDTGPGIPADQMPKLFKKFGQLNTPEQTQTKMHGTGLGLIIAKDVVEGHGGRIWAESNGQGATFIFTLPKAGGGGGGHK